MKKYSILILVLVLTALTLAGCRNPNNAMDSTTVPTTNATTAPTVMPTEATTRPTETTPATTVPEYTNPTGTTPDGTTTTDATEGTDGMNPTTATGEARSRSMPGRR